MLKRARLLVVWMFISGPVLAAQDSDPPLSADDWKELMEKVALLEDSGLMPSLLFIRYTVRFFLS